MHFFMLSDFSSRLSELQEWLSPLKSLTSYNCEGVAAAVGQLKHFGEDLQKIPRSLVTVVRVLKEMTVPPDTRYPDGKYLYNRTTGHNVKFPSQVAGNQFRVQHL